MDKILMIVKLIPAVIEVMKSIEAAIPGNGKGEQKLAAVREILESLDATAKDLWPQISAVVAVLVKLFNSTGAWVK